MSAVAQPIACRAKVVRPSVTKAFTLIELLVVIAIIAILIGLLLPAVQKVRAAAASAQAQQSLGRLSQAMNAHRSQLGFYPGAISQLSPFIDGENVWSDNQDQGYNFTVALLPQPDGATDFRITATPAVIGLTADNVWFVMKDMVVRNGTTAQHRALAAQNLARAQIQLIDEGSRQIASVLQEGANKANGIPAFVRNPRTVDNWLSEWDWNGDGMLAFDEVMNVPGPDHHSIPEFRRSFASILAFGEGQEDLTGLPAVQISGLEGDPAPIFTFDSLSTLVRLHTTSQPLRIQLLTVLEIADWAECHSQWWIRAAALQTFVAEVQRNSGRGIPQNRAATMIAIAAEM